MIYLGPYFEIAIPIVQSTVDYCRNKKICKNPSKGNYCEDCGISIKERFSEIDLGTNLELDLIVNEALFQTEKVIKTATRRITYLLPTHNRNSLRKFIFYPEFKEREVIQMFENQIPNDIKWLEESFDNEIKTIKTLRPDIEFLGTKWGLIFD